MKPPHTINVALFHTFEDTIENYLPEDTLYIGRGPARAEYNIMCSEGKLFFIVSKKVWNKAIITSRLSSLVSCCRHHCIQVLLLLQSVLVSVVIRDRDLATTDRATSSDL